MRGRERRGEGEGEGELLPPKLCVGMHTHRVHAVPREPIHTTSMGDGFRLVWECLQNGPSIIGVNMHKG